MPLDYYKILGVSRNADDAEIKKQYRTLARKYHPDVSKLKNAEKRFKEINEAYEVLKNKEKRQNYDRFGSADGNPFAAGGFTPPPGGGRSQNWNQSDFGGFGQGSFSDIFEKMFKQGGHSQNSGSNFNFGQSNPFSSGGGSSRNDSASAEAQVINIAITLEEAYQGAEKNFRLSIPGQKEPKRLKVKIPKGISEGQKIRLNKQAAGGADLFLKVEFKSHHLFQNKQNDIYLNLPVTIWEAAFGASLSVPTLGGHVEIKIPPGSQSGKKLRLKNRGLGKVAGDQYVTLMIKMDPNPNPELEQLYREIQKNSHFNPREQF